MIVIVMGVSGAGKSTVGAALAAQLGWVFVEGDAFHPLENVAKMAAGDPLTDTDRAPWLAAIRAHLGKLDASGRSAVLACSALKAQYRAVLTRGLDARFVYLDVPEAVLESRLRARQGHFAGASLLPSQLATLEVPTGAIRLDATQPLDALVDAAVVAVGAVRRVAEGEPDAR